MPSAYNDHQQPALGLANHEIELCFVNPLPKEYECPVCRQVLRYPVQFEECEHHVCSGCLRDVERNESRCPVDHVKIERAKVYVNKQLQRTIQALPMKCSFHDKGCAWRGELLEIPNHVVECDYTPVNCPRECGVMFERRFQEHHLRDDCQKRSMTCDYCHAEIRQEQRVEHWRACSLYPMECPNQCGRKNIQREKLRQHMETDCPKCGSACPFAEFGCQYKGEKITLSKHIRDEPTRHLSLLCDGVVEMKRMLQSAQLSAEKSGLKIQQLNTKADSLEKLYGAQMLWKVENYQQKFNEAKAGTRATLFSPPFLTGRHGYKMAASVCLFGDGQARGQYLSIFVCLCRGEYDSLLSWPFSHRVTITLLDQCQDPAGRKNITYTVKPNTAKENRPFLARPTGERNASFGAQKFCELVAIEKLDYVRDDTIFIKVQVDTSDMTPL